ncbi:MAG: hypothetical protein WCV69_03205 [Patescibacteria group bacterium]|jgi:hypothetical protein
MEKTRLPGQWPEIQNEDRGKILDENTYYEECLTYALDIGWIQASEKDLLIEKHLKPIYQKYLNIIQEVTAELQKEKDSGTTIEKIIEKLNYILERTKRIGSTAPDNIIRSIDDYYRFSCTNNTYAEYAAMALYQFIAQNINQ